MSSMPLVSIGLPVYNGMPHLRGAIECLLKQSYANFEIVICDNASDDGTSEYCRALAQVYPRVRYARNEMNLGPLANFRLVLEHASGDFFMWASDDDRWNERFVSGLVERLTAEPEAVLATPTVIHIREDGRLCSEPPDRSATGESKRANLTLLFHDHAASWIYGVWRTAWLRRHFAEYCAFPYWGADILWLADICLGCSVVGDQDAVIFKRLRRSGFRPKSARATLCFWCYMVWHLTRIGVRRTTRFRERAHVLALSWAYVYRVGIRRPHLLRTLWRVVRMVSIAAITGLPLAVAWAARRLARAVLPARAL